MATYQNLDEIRKLIEKVTECDEEQQKLLRTSQRMYSQYLEHGANGAEARARLLQLGIRID